MTSPEDMIELDARVADLFGVGARVRAGELARAVAELAGFERPTTPDHVDFWLAVATCIDEQLGRVPIEVMDSAEASHYVKMCVGRKHEAAGQAAWRSALGGKYLAEALGEWLMYDVVEGMADRGAFRLVGRRGRPPYE